MLLLLEPRLELRESVEYRIRLFRRLRIGGLDMRGPFVLGHAEGTERSPEGVHSELVFVEGFDIQVLNADGAS